MFNQVLMGHSLSNWICRSFKCTSTPRRLSHEGTEPLDSSSAVTLWLEGIHTGVILHSAIYFTYSQIAINFVP